MPRKAKKSAPQLTESWASMEEEAESVDEFSSEDDRSPPQADLTSSRASHLDDALGHGPRRRSIRTDLPSGSRPTPQNSVLMESMAASNQQTSRRRQMQSQRPKDEPTFVMPNIDNDTKGRMNSPRQKIVRQPKSVGVRNDRPSKTEIPITTNIVDVLQALWANDLSPSIHYAFSTIWMAAAFAKPLIAVGLLGWLLFALFVMIQTSLTNAISTALSPICHVPGVGLLHLPFCDMVDRSPQDSGPVEFDRLMAAQAAFEEILTTSVDSGSLPLAMKRSEAATRDLRTVVKHSTLPSRHELVFEISGFIDTAYQAASDLSKFNVRIGGAVDRILSTNHWTLRVLDEIADSRANRGSIGRLLSAPFSPHPPTSGAAVFDQYLRHTSAIEERVEALVMEAKELLGILQNLNERMDAINDIATRDGVKVEGDKDDLFAYLWTKLGGNRSGVAKLEAQLKILKEVGQYRNMAIAHVSVTIVKLEEVSQNLADLRERVGAPRVGSVEIPLEMYVNEILMGVERLEAVRNDGKLIEDKRVRSILDRNDWLAVEGS